MKDIKMGLKILKENEEGFGIIIDQDGNITKELNENFLNEGTLSGSIDLTKPIYYYATLQKYGVENRNGRIYPEDILKREVERYRDVIRRNASFHELDHPQESVISLKGGSPHRIVDMFWEGNALIGKLEILVSEGYRKNGVISCNGDLTAMYLSYGMTLGISSRGIGSLKKVNGKNVVQNDFELICWDIVSSPSTPGSYLYKNPEDFAKYDEELTNEPEMNAGSKDKQDEFLSKLTSFLSK
jgi:hypothetical protein